jgi:hypothetical protein
MFVQSRLRAGGSRLRTCLFLYLELDDLSEEKIDHLTTVGAQRGMTHDQDIQGALAAASRGGLRPDRLSLLTALRYPARFVWCPSKFWTELSSFRRWSRLWREE